MKKYALVLVLVVLVALVGCKEHEHTWKKLDVSTPATCLYAGEDVYECISCGAERVESVPATGVHEYNEEGNCVFCGNEKTKIESAEARIGKVYYANFEDAVHAAVKDGGMTVEVLKESIVLSDAHCPEVNGSVSINANGADFGNGDLSVYTFNRSGNEPQSGDVSIVINDAKNLFVWGQPDNLRSENTEINIEMNRCENVGVSKTKEAGRMVYLTGAKGITNVTLNECSVTKADSPVYTNASGTIVIKDCSFVECAVPVNMNYKAAEGSRNITIDGCEFIGCGCAAEEDSSLSAYAAPIRVVHSVAGSDSYLTIRNTSVTGTVGSNGDVLLLDTRDAKKVQSETAVLEDNKTDLKVVYGIGSEDSKVVLAGAKETIEVKMD